MKTLIPGLCFLLAASAVAVGQVGKITSAATADGIKVSGAIDAGHRVVVRLERGEKSLEWKSDGQDASTFEATIDASNQIPLGGGKVADGFVFTSKVGNGKTVTNVATAGEPVSGKLVVRPNAAWVTKNGAVVFADVVGADGTKSPVSVGVEKK